MEINSQQTETKASVGLKASVRDYKLTYNTLEYDKKRYYSLILSRRREKILE